MYVSGTATLSSRPSVASGGICCTGSPFIERGMEKRSCYRKRIRYFFHSSFLYLNAGTSRTLFCHLVRQSRGLLAEADSSTPVLRTFARNDIATPSDLPPGMTEKAKTVGKRNSFPGFSFFDSLSFALFLFLSCGDADVSSAFGFVVLVCIFIYFCL